MNNIPLWQTLKNTTGTHLFSYPESSRIDVYQLFEHHPQKILDIGCATGVVGRSLKERYNSSWVWGCELNTDSAKTAASRIDYVTTNPIQESSLHDVTLLKEVDTILLLDVLEHMYNPWGELQYLNKHISPSTQLIVSIPNIAHVSIMQNLANGVWEYRSLGIMDITHIRFFTLQQMQKMFIETGYNIEKSVRLSGNTPQKIERFPVVLDMGSMKLTVKDEEQWDSLFTIQYGFRLRKIN